MTIREAFPGLIGHASDSERSILDAAFALGDAAACDAVLLLAIRQQRSIADVSTRCVIDWTMVFLTDLVPLKSAASSEDEHVVLDFLRFVVCTGLMGHCFGTGQMNRTMDWIALSLSDDFRLGEGNLQFETDVLRLSRFLESSHGSLVRNGALMMCNWSKVTYAYSKMMEAFVEGALATVRACVQAGYREMGRYDEGFEALQAIAYWAIDFEPRLAEHLARFFEHAYAGGSPHSGAIAVALATRLGVWTGSSPEAWARIVRADYWTRLRPAERIELLTQLIKTPEDYDEHRRELFELVDELRPTPSADPVAVEQHRERSLKAFGALLVSLILSGRSHDAVDFIVHWYSPTSEEHLTDAICFIPFSLRGAVWGFGKQAWTHTHADGVRAEAIEALNAALSSTFAPGEIVVPKRPGNPNERFATELIEVTATVLGVEQLQAHELPTNVPFVTLSSAPFPYQTTMLARLGRTWPSTVSLQQRRPDRQLKRVGIWVLQRLLLGDEEASGISKAFSAQGVTVESAYSGGGDELERFMAMYANHDLDALWVIGHGRHVALAPDESSLDILESGDAIEIALLIPKLPRGESRRLLVLNVCSSARPTGSGGGLPRVSMAGLCAASSQAVVGHLWPVSFRAAYAFGLLLACNLAKATTFFDSYARTVATVQLGNVAVADALETSDLPVEAEMFRHGESLTSELDCYSAAFYE